MAFSVRNIAVERRARAYAQRHGLSLTTGIGHALARAEKDDEEAREAEFQKWKAYVADIQAAYAEAGPSGRTEQDIMGWDENGLPT